MRGNQSNVAHREQNVTRWEKNYSVQLQQMRRQYVMRKQEPISERSYGTKTQQKVRNQSKRVIEVIICDKINKTSLHVQQQMKSQHGTR